MPTTRNICCTVCYDGTDFSGWQRQDNARTVQAEVERALEKLHGYAITVNAAGRTDAGVHALGQVINFRTASTVPIEKYPQAINQHLPLDVRIFGSSEEVEEFDARKSATSRSYTYRIRVGEFLHPLDRNHCFRVLRQPDISLLNAMAGTLVGTHDFATFTAAGSSSVTTMRNVFSASFHIGGPYIEFRISANAFLWKMVRSIVGTLLEAEDNRRPAGYIREILTSRDRASAGTTAPGRGLYLRKVRYDGVRVHA